MDWQKRNYYLVSTDSSSYQTQHDYYLIAAPSLKRHLPYNHFKEYMDYANYDGIHIHWYPQEMLSCQIEESSALEYELEKTVRNGDGRFYKLTKEICGQ